AAARDLIRLNEASFRRGTRCRHAGSRRSVARVRPAPDPVKTQGGRRRRTAALWGGRDVAIALDQGRAAVGAQTVASGKRARVCLMVRINYISHDGTRREVDVNEGL